MTHREPATQSKGESQPVLDYSALGGPGVLSSTRCRIGKSAEVYYGRLFAPVAMK